MPTSLYAKRVERLARAFGLLLHHPDGLTLEQLSAETRLPAATLRADLAVFMNRDLPATHDLALTDGIGLELLTEAGEETVSAEAVRVRLTSAMPLTELGLEYFAADVLGPLYRAARDLSALEPGNEVLAAAVQRLTETLLTGIDADVPYGGETAGMLREAARERQRVRIDYWRAWRPGAGTRVIEPYRVVSTRRGFEVDAGPLDAEGDIRTFLVSGIRDVVVLPETFERPDDVDDRIERSRRLATVRVVVPRDLLWVVTRFAESTTVVRSDDDLEVEAHVLPPVADRVGLMMTIAGPDAFVVAPTSLAEAGAETAGRLLAHHGLR